MHPEWERDFSWLVQGTTAREAGDFASFGERPAAALHLQWQRLRRATGMHAAVLGRQIHGARVLSHGSLPPGLLITDDADGHMTAAPGVLLAATVADCVPVFVVQPHHREVAILHAGWRGIAAGIVRACSAGMSGDVRVHLGPAICGDCYEVGPEVHAALGLRVPAGAMPVDLRAVLSAQLYDLGIPQRHLTASSWCTRCGDSLFYSHRGGHAERQVGVIGIR